MQNNDLNKFAKLMMAISEVFDGGKAPSELKMEIYFQALKGYDIETLQRSMERMIATRIYPSFPKPGEIIQEIEGAKEDQALLAWGEVVEAIKHTGPYQSVRFKDPTIHAVIEFMGGWPTTGDWLEDELKWKQKEFERLYGIMKTRGTDKKYLPGICEISNGAKGLTGKDKVVLIGSEPTQRRIEG